MVSVQKFERPTKYRKCEGRERKQDVRTEQWMVVGPHLLEWRPSKKMEAENQAQQEIRGKKMRGDLGTKSRKGLG